MKRSPFLSLWLSALCAGVIAGCGTGEDAGDTTASAAAARAGARSTWKLELEGAEALPLERMDIYLVENEHEDAEIFELYGADVILVGTFPRDVHVGYEEDLSKLVGRTIALQPSGGDPREPKNAWVRVAGVPFPVTGGSFTVEKVTGRWSGSEGDKTCHGTIELEVEGAEGRRKLRGRFAVHGVTWG